MKFALSFCALLLSTATFAGEGVPLIAKDMKGRIAKLLQHCTKVKAFTYDGQVGKHLTTDLSRPGCRQAIDLSPGVGNLEWGSQIASLSFAGSNTIDSQRLTVRFNYININPTRFELRLAVGDAMVGSGASYVYSEPASLGLLAALALISEAHIPGFAPNEYHWSKEMKGAPL